MEHFGTFSTKPMMRGPVVRKLYVVLGRPSPSIIN